MQTVDINKLKELESQGWLKSQTHPTLPLTIWNYTNSVQWEDYWTELTLMCRGLVTDDEGNIVARPLKKFFNYSELAAKNQLPTGNFTVYEKMDGSYIQIFWYKDQWVVSSRGSFTSPHAEYAKEILTRYGVLVGEEIEGVFYDFEPLDVDCNYIFELIHPDTRIVVDYGQKEDLVLLAVIENETGDEANVSHYSDYFQVVEKVELHPSVEVSSWDELKEEIPDNKEGYVIKFDSGERMKIKGDEYCRLHRIVTMTSSYDIWECLRSNKSLDDLLERVPDEWMNWVHQTVGKLYLEYRKIQQQLNIDLLYGCEKGMYGISVNGEILYLYESRKEVAKYFQTCQYPKLMFNKLDNKGVNHLIWNMIKPEHEKGFSI